MEKRVGKLRLKKGFEGEYRRRHDALWPEMRDMMREAGIRNYTIWLDGEFLIEYMEAESLDRMRSVLSQSETKRRWDAYMSDIVEPVDSAIGLVFSFD